MKNLMKFLFLSATLSLTTLTQAQELQKNLDSFNKIIVSPKINLVLQKGEQESIRIRYSNVSPDKINIESQQQSPKNLSGRCPHCGEAQENTFRKLLI